MTGQLLTQIASKWNRAGVRKSECGFCSTDWKVDYGGLPKMLWKMSWLLMSLEAVSVSLTLVKNIRWYSPATVMIILMQREKILFPNTCCRENVFLASFSPLLLCKNFNSNFSFNRLCEAAGWPKGPQQAEEKCSCQQLCDSLRHLSSALSSQSVWVPVWEPIAAHLRCLIGRELRNCYKSTTPRVQHRNQTEG